VKLLFPASRPLWPLFDAGYAGVDIFFVLSGFIISYTYLDKFSSWSLRGQAKFLWLRLARIYPVHIATVLFFLLYNQPGTVLDVTRSGLTAAVRHPDFRDQLLLVHAWGVGETRAWNYPAWSISVEWLAYLAFPIVAVVLVRVRSIRAALLGFAAALALNVGIYLAISLAGENGRIPMLRIIGEFLAGAFLYLLWSQGWLKRFNWRRVNPALVLAGVGVTVAIAQSSDIAPVVAAPFYALVILGLAYGRDHVSLFLARRPTVYLGEASYSLYMTHAVSQAWLWNHFPAADFTSDSRAERALVLLGYAAVIGVVALACYHLIEKPGRAIMRRATEPHRKLAESVARVEPSRARGAP
jgi:peptidoglycan/LPS O-acetylase OafA/YrhL